MPKILSILYNSVGKKHLKNQQVLGKHQQPFTFPKAKSHPYNHPKQKPKPLPWQTSDINDLHRIPGVLATNFENPASNKQPSRHSFMNNQKFSQGDGGVSFTAGIGFDRGFGGGGSGYDIVSHRGHCQGNRPSFQGDTSRHCGNHSGLSIQGHTKDLDSINKLLHKQALLAELEQSLTESRNTNVAHGSGERDESRGQGWYGDRHHPYA